MVSFFSHRFGKHKGCPTKRAQMKGEVKDAKKIEEKLLGRE